MQSIFTLNSDNVYYRNSKNNKNIIQTINYEEFRNIIQHDDFKFDKKTNSVKTPSAETQEALVAWEKFVNFFQKNNISMPVIYLDEMLLKKIDKKKYNEYTWYKNYVDKMKEFYKENKVFIDDWKKEFQPLKWKNKRNRKLEWQAGNLSFRESYLQIRQSGLRFRNNNLFPTLVASVQTPLVFKNKWRYLTTNEARQLQNFPQHHIIHNNEHQAYKQFGNAVNVYVTAFVIMSYLGIFLEGLNE